MRRLDPSVEYAGSGDYMPGMEEAADGDYVDWDDVAPILARLGLPPTATTKDALAAIDALVRAMGPLGEPPLPSPCDLCGRATCRLRVCLAAGGPA